MKALSKTTKAMLHQYPNGGGVQVILEFFSERRQRYPWGDSVWWRRRPRTRMQSVALCAVFVWLVFSRIGVTAERLSSATRESRTS